MLLLTYLICATLFLIFWCPCMAIDVGVQYNLGLLPDIMYGHTYSQSMNQPGKVANPARGQLNR